MPADYRLRLIFAFLSLLLLHCEPISGEDQWCYQCNTDLANGHKVECNDPYAAGHSMDFVLCPKNESYHCVKGIVFYKHVLATVRACVPTRQIHDYCRYEQYFPEASIECSFCKGYACNHRASVTPNSAWKLGLIALFLVFPANVLFA